MEYSITLPRVQFDVFHASMLLVCVDIEEFHESTFKDKHF